MDGQNTELSDLFSSLDAQFPDVRDPFLMDSALETSSSYDIAFDSQMSREEELEDELQSSSMSMLSKRCIPREDMQNELTKLEQELENNNEEDNSSSVGHPQGPEHLAPVQELVNDNKDTEINHQSPKLMNQEQSSQKNNSGISAINNQSPQITIAISESVDKGSPYKDVPLLCSERLDDQHTSNEEVMPECVLSSESPPKVSSSTDEQFWFHSKGEHTKKTHSQESLLCTATSTEDSNDCEVQKQSEGTLLDACTITKDSALTVCDFICDTSNRLDERPPSRGCIVDVVDTRLLLNADKSALVNLDDKNDDKAGLARLDKRSNDSESVKNTDDSNILRNLGSYREPVEDINDPSLLDCLYNSSNTSLKSECTKSNNSASQMCLDNNIGPTEKLDSGRVTEDAGTATSSQQCVKETLHEVDDNVSVVSDKKTGTNYNTSGAVEKDRVSSVSSLEYNISGDSKVHKEGIIPSEASSQKDCISDSAKTSAGEVPRKASKQSERINNSSGTSNTREISQSSSPKHSLSSYIPAKKAVSPTMAHSYVDNDIAKDLELSDSDDSDDDMTDSDDMKDLGGHVVRHDTPHDTEEEREKQDEQGSVRLDKERDKNNTENDEEVKKLQDLQVEIVIHQHASQQGTWPDNSEKGNTKDALESDKDKEILQRVCLNPDEEVTDNGLDKKCSDSNIEKVEEDRAKVLAKVKDPESGAHVQNPVLENSPVTVQEPEVINHSGKSQNPELFIVQETHKEINDVPDKSSEAKDSNGTEKSSDQKEKSIHRKILDCKSENTDKSANEKEPSDTENAQEFKPRRTGRIRRQSLKVSEDGSVFLPVRASKVPYGLGGLTKLVKSPAHLREIPHSPRFSSPDSECDMKIAPIKVESKRGRGVAKRGLKGCRLSSPGGSDDARLTSNQSFSRKGSKSPRFSSPGSDADTRLSDSQSCSKKGCKSPSRGARKTQRRSLNPETNTCVSVLNSKEKHSRLSSPELIKSTADMSSEEEIFQSHQGQGLKSTFVRGKPSKNPTVEASSSLKQKATTRISKVRKLKLMHAKQNQNLYEFFPDEDPPTLAPEREPVVNVQVIPPPPTLKPHPKVPRQRNLFKSMVRVRRSKGADSDSTVRSPSPHQNRAPTEKGKKMTKKTGKAITTTAGEMSSNTPATSQDGTEAKTLTSSANQLVSSPPRPWPLSPPKPSVKGRSELAGLYTHVNYDWRLVPKRKSREERRASRSQTSDSDSAVTGQSPGRTVTRVEQKDFDSCVQVEGEENNQDISMDKDMDKQEEKSRLQSPRSKVISNAQKARPGTIGPMGIETDKMCPQQSSGTISQHHTSRLQKTEQSSTTKRHLEHSRLRRHSLRQTSASQLPEMPGSAEYVVTTSGESTSQVSVTISDHMSIDPTKFRCKPCSVQVRPLASTVADLYTQGPPELPSRTTRRNVIRKVRGIRPSNIVTNGVSSENGKTGTLMDIEVQNSEGGTKTKTASTRSIPSPLASLVPTSAAFSFAKRSSVWSRQFKRAPVKRSKISRHADKFWQEQDSKAQKVLNLLKRQKRKRLFSQMSKDEEGNSATKQPRVDLAQSTRNIEKRFTRRRLSEQTKQSNTDTNMDDEAHSPKGITMSQALNTNVEDHHKTNVERDAKDTSKLSVGSKQGLKRPQTRVSSLKRRENSLPTSSQHSDNRTDTETILEDDLINDGNKSQKTFTCTRIRRKSTIGGNPNSATDQGLSNQSRDNDYNKDTRDKRNDKDKHSTSLDVTKSTNKDNDMDTNIETNERILAATVNGADDSDPESDADSVTLSDIVHGHGQGQTGTEGQVTGNVTHCISLSNSQVLNNSRNSLSYPNFLD